MSWVIILLTSPQGQEDLGRRGESGVFFSLDKSGGQGVFPVSVCRNRWVKLVEVLGLRGPFPFPKAG